MLKPRHSINTKLHSSASHCDKLQNSPITKNEQRHGELREKEEQDPHAVRAVRAAELSPPEEPLRLLRLPFQPHPKMSSSFVASTNQLKKGTSCDENF
ncbi:hypothetical protein ACFX2J_017614 [Malus domestica]|uniref:Uncharacterized protein n=1 Tax=Malus domestica TaxID=3750 RepID=A0A498I058_MALDO|nr:hypothetical protein DVH24_029264 [Malus domestica]